MDQNDAAPTKDRPLPGHETQSGEMACPKCGRFVGAATKCPYCGAKVEKRMSLVAIRWAAVLLSTVGLVLLYWMAKTRDPERIKIGDIETTMNFGLVRLSGEVKNDARPFKNGNGMSFNVADGSGSIIVFVDQTQRQQMIDSGLVPRKGDGIDFVVQLQASSSGHSARIRSLNPASFKLTRADGTPAGSATARAAAPARSLGPAVPFSAVDESLVGQSVVLEGTVISIKEPDAGTKQPYVLTIGDGTANLEVKTWADQFLQIRDPKSLPGTAVRVKAAVKLFRGKVDLSLKKGTDLQRAGEAAAETSPAEEPAAGPSADSALDLGPSVPFSAVDESLVGQSVVVEGTVASLKEPDAGTKQPYVLTLTNATESVEIKFWSDQYRHMADPQTLTGTAVRVKVAVKLYRGKVDLQLKKGSDLRRSGEVPKKPRERKPPVPVAQVTAASAGGYATVEGSLSEPSDRAGKGTAYTLADGSGSITVVFWNNTVPPGLQEKAAAAKRVRVNGKVADFRGNLQITPKSDGLEILE